MINDDVIDEVREEDQIVDQGQVKREIKTDKKWTTMASLSREATKYTPQSVAIMNSNYANNQVAGSDPNAVNSSAGTIRTVTPQAAVSNIVAAKVVKEFFTTMAKRRRAGGGNSGRGRGA